MRTAAPPATSTLVRRTSATLVTEGTRAMPDTPVTVGIPVTVDTRVTVGTAGLGLELLGLALALVLLGPLGLGPPALGPGPGPVLVLAGGRLDGAAAAPAAAGVLRRLPPLPPRRP